MTDNRSPHISLSVFHLFLRCSPVMTNFIGYCSIQKDLYSLYVCVSLISPMASQVTCDFPILLIINKTEVHFVVEILLISARSSILF